MIEPSDVIVYIAAAFVSGLFAGCYLWDLACRIGRKKLAENEAKLMAHAKEQMARRGRLRNGGRPAIETQDMWLPKK